MQILSLGGVRFEQSYRVIFIYKGRSGDMALYIYIYFAESFNWFKFKVCTWFSITLLTAVQNVENRKRFSILRSRIIRALQRKTLMNSFHATQYPFHSNYFPAFCATANVLFLSQYMSFEHVLFRSLCRHVFFYALPLFTFTDSFYTNMTLNNNLILNVN